MKKYFLCLLFVCTLVSAGAQSLFVGSYNIRYKNALDAIEGNSWSERCPVICSMINFESPDVFGAQEVLDQQIQNMLSLLDGYAYIGVGRDDGKKAGEFSPIFYKESKYSLLSHGTFWLSPTPQKIGSKGWDAALPRICTWGHFKSRTSSFSFWYFNLHMDHIGVVARRESAKLVVANIKKMCKDEMVVLTGDFNVDQKDEVYSIFAESGLLKDSYQTANHRFAENGTFNSFKSTVKTDSRIDHVFVSQKFVVDRYGILTNMYWSAKSDNEETLKGKDAPSQIDFKKYQLRIPSDHYPIFVHLKYQTK
jgi:endonuclease/exonuclease/phosphatase family metal-dependent hydrolase